MKVTICDACGNTVGNDGGKLLTHIKTESYTLGDVPLPENFDLCHGCSDALRGKFFDLKK